MNNDNVQWQCAHVMMNNDIVQSQCAMTMCNDTALTGGPAAAQPTPSSSSLRCLLDIAVPLLQTVIGEGGDAKDGRGGHGKDQVGSDREANVVDAAMGALGAVARALPWHHYDTLLSQFMRTMKVGMGDHVVVLCSLSACLGPGKDDQSPCKVHQIVF